MRAVILGTAVLDFLALVERLPGPDAPVGNALDAVVAPGGSGATMALAAARLGVATGLVARLGGDSAAGVVMQRLHAGGVDLLVPPRRGARTDRLIGQVTAGGEACASLLGSAGSMIEPTDVAAVAEHLGAAHVVFASTAVPLPAVAAALRAGRGAGALTVLRAAPPAPAAADLLHLVDVLGVDRDGAFAYTGIPPRDRPSAYRVARALLGRGPRLAAVGAGPAGTLVAWPDGYRWLSTARPDDNGPAPVRSVAPTGAADALITALAVSLVEGCSPADAAEFAGAAALLATRSLAAQDALPDRGEIARLLGGAPPALRPAAPPLPVKGNGHAVTPLLAGRVAGRAAVPDRAAEPQRAVARDRAAVARRVGRPDRAAEPRRAAAPDRVAATPDGAAGSERVPAVDGAVNGHQRRGAARRGRRPAPATNPAATAPGATAVAAPGANAATAPGAIAPGATAVAAPGGTAAAAARTLAEVTGRRVVDLGGRAAEPAGSPPWWGNARPTVP